MSSEDQLPPFLDPDFERAPSPLIYPGGKSRAIPIIVPLILEGMRRAQTDALVSPFLGGGNLEVTCARQGVQVLGSDVSLRWSASGATCLKTPKPWLTQFRNI